MISTPLAQALTTSGNCANKAIQIAYETMMADMFASTSQSTPISTLFLNLATRSSDLVEEADIATNHGDLYSVKIFDKSNNTTTEYIVEFTSTGCYKKQADAVLSGEE